MPELVVIGTFIATGAFLLTVLIFWFLKATKLCSGGSLVQGCGKPIFPWQDRVATPGGNYCCMNCFKKEMQLYTASLKDSKGGEENACTESNS